jgi:hypothetical protein
MLFSIYLERVAMQAYRVEAKVQQGGLLTLSNLPLQAGEEVEVIILVRPPKVKPENPYPLRGRPITYINPTEPVASSDWEASQ